MENKHSAGPRPGLWQRLPAERRESIKWVSPSLIFMGFGFYGAFQSGAATLKGGLTLAMMLAFLAIYMASWLVVDTAPRTVAQKGRFVAFAVALTLLQLAMLAWTELYVDGTGMAFMLTYVAAQVIFQSPRSWMWMATLAVFAVAVGEYLLFPQETLFPVLIVVVTSGTCILSRAAVEGERRREVEHSQALDIAQERERNRMSADLHDILGQTLTGITMKADLASRLLDAGRVDDARAQLDDILGQTLTGITMKADLASRLLDAGRVDDARAQLDDLTEMSRTALTEVRQVVSANRTLLPETELASAQRLVESIGASFELVTQAQPAPGIDSTLVAHTIREATTNAVRHSTPSSVRVTLRADGVSVENDLGGVAVLDIFTRGVGLKERAAAPRDTAGIAPQGSGLEGLRQRVGQRGALTWGPQAGKWVVKLELNHD
ncbi:MAG: histidine kinase [Buchananella hordeovulneris]|nr:histidine kinase [Buchananella hordeovulneris]